MYDQSSSSMVMDADCANVRISGRKVKRKVFDDFVSTSTRLPLGVKRKIREQDSEDGEKGSKITFQEIDATEDSKLSIDEGSLSSTPVGASVPQVVKESQELKTDFFAAKSRSDENIEKNVKTSKVELLGENSSVVNEENLNQKQLSEDHIPKETNRKRKKNETNPLKKRIKKNVFSTTKQVRNRKLRKTKQQYHLKLSNIANGTEISNKHVCKKVGCGKRGLSCCIKASVTCVEMTGKTARWYHLSKEEHYCNGCFELFYRVKNNTCDKLYEWKKAWVQNSRADANFKNITTYIAERQLPYWVQCTLCGHWRSLSNEVDITPKIVRSYTCSVGNMANTIEDHTEDNGYVHRRAPLIKYSCLEPNDSCVNVALDRGFNWMGALNYVPLLKHSPAAPFLTGYYPDGVGMSVVDTDNCRKLDEFATPVNQNDDVIRPVKIMQKINAKKKNGEDFDKVKIPAPCDQSSMITSPGGRKRTYKETAAPVEGLSPYFQPFYKPHERGKALCMRPDVMELDEAEEFPSYYKDQTVYLAIRNLIISLWTFNPCQLLTSTKCCQHLILRGLTRVRLCCIDEPQILCFATRKGLVNLGAIKRPISRPGKATHAPKHAGTLPLKYSNQKVVVIGTGPAGLGAARQLHNFGCEVVCLEARDRIGGRVDDDWSLDGVCVGKGAQIINGCVNNPLALMSHQLGLKMHTLQPRCDLFDGKREGKAKRRSPTKAVTSQCDKRMDFHFNALLDIIVEWRQAQAQDALDCSLGEKIQEAHREWMKQSGLSFSELEERLLNFHIGNLEFACGASLNQVSAFHWDQNEIFSQFSGDHTFVQYGFGTLLAALAEGLDIRYKSPVSNVIIQDEQVLVKTENGKEHTADRVLVTVPLAVLRSGSIRFQPDLSVEKQQAMDRLGCGCIEKIALLFPHRFWGKKIEGANYFGYVPSKPDKKGFFSVFYDVPYPLCQKSKVLMSVVSGEAVEDSRRLIDEEVLEIALSILRDIFPEENVPQPKKYFVTRWKDDPYSKMAYSYVKRGSSGDDYDAVAKEIDDKIFFAGEGTNRHFPQTVTGAYLSGVREASKIANSNNLKCQSTGN